jgi:pimeloyl-ACP methyl ester carboxylesterase
MSSAPQIQELAVPVDGGTLAAYRFGDADAPPVLAVHGITGNSRAWLAAARALGDRASLIAVDLRGRAGSRELPAPYGTAAYVADLAAVIERLGIGPALVVGHSLGAYTVSRLGVEHPELVRGLVLVDGGLTIPGSLDVEPQRFVDAFLGQTLSRLSLQFASPDAYLAWWLEHPAFAGHDVDTDDLRSYATHDLTGVAPRLHSSVIEPAVRADAEELTTLGSWAPALERPATFLCAPRGLHDEPKPMQPLALVQAWAAERGDRTAVPVDDVNHYTLAMGARGAAAIAEAIAAALASPAAV